MATHAQLAGDKIVVAIDADDLRTLSGGRCGALLTPRAAQDLARDLSRALIASGVMKPGSGARGTAAGSQGKNHGKGKRPCPRRRGFDSEAAARAANEHAPWRYRAYLCDGCSKWHVTNQDKGRDSGVPRGR